MAISLNLWLENDGRATVKVRIDVSGREGSIEIMELMHSAERPAEKCLHSSDAFMKCDDN